MCFQSYKNKGQTRGFGPFFSFHINHIEDTGDFVAGCAVPSVGQLGFPEENVVGADHFAVLVPQLSQAFLLKFLKGMPHGKAGSDVSSSVFGNREGSGTVL